MAPDRMLAGEPPLDAYTDVSSGTGEIYFDPSLHLDLADLHEHSLLDSAISTNASNAGSFIVSLPCYVIRSLARQCHR